LHTFVAHPPTVNHTEVRLTELTDADAAEPMTLASLLMFFILPRLEDVGVLTNPDPLVPRRFCFCDLFVAKTLEWWQARQEPTHRWGGWQTLAQPFPERKRGCP
jgi:hypothetical protein